MAADTLAASTDFSKAVFNKEEVARAVVSQYDDEKTVLFYKLVMGAPCAAACSSTQQHSGKCVRCRAGGGGESIHYGIFRSPTDGVREASEASTDFMMTCMDWARPVRCAPRPRGPLHVRRLQLRRGADSCGARAYCCSAARAGDGGEPRLGSGLGTRRLRARAGAALRLPRAGAPPAPLAFPPLAQRAAARRARLRCLLRRA